MSGSVKRKGLLEIDLEPGGKGKIKLDGLEIPRARALKVDCAVGEPNRAVIEIIAPKIIGRIEETETELRMVPLISDPGDGR